MPMKTKPEHEITFQKLTALIKEQTDKGISSEELLAIAANMLGKILALQNQRTMTRDRAMAIITRNLELGNQQVVDELAKTGGEKN
jgi:hypothetical protein